MDIYYDCQTEYTMDRGTQDKGSFKWVHYNMTGILSSQFQAEIDPKKIKVTAPFGCTHHSG